MIFRRGAHPDSLCGGRGPANSLERHLADVTKCLNKQGKTRYGRYAGMQSWRDSAILNRVRNRVKLFARLLVESPQSNFIIIQLVDWPPFSLLLSVKVMDLLPLTTL